MTLRKAKSLPLNAVGLSLYATAAASLGLSGMVICNGIQVFAPVIDKSETAAYVVFGMFTLLYSIGGPTTLFVIPLAWIHAVKSSKGGASGGGAGSWRKTELIIGGIGSLCVTLVALCLFTGMYAAASLVAIAIALFVNVAYYFGAKTLVPLLSKGAAMAEGGGAKKIDQSTMITWLARSINLSSCFYIISALCYFSFSGVDENDKSFPLAPFFQGMYMLGAGNVQWLMLRYLRFSYRKVLLKHGDSFLKDANASKVAASEMATSINSSVDDSA
jgi:hypothetical protein